MAVAFLFIGIGAIFLAIVIGIIVWQTHSSVPINDPKAKTDPDPDASKDCNTEGAEDEANGSNGATTTCPPGGQDTTCGGLADAGTQPGDGPPDDPSDIDTGPDTDPDSDPTDTVTSDAVSDTESGTDVEELCGENEMVFNGDCISCDVGLMAQTSGGDVKDGPNTQCIKDPTFVAVPCTETQYALDSVCFECPHGQIGDRGDGWDPTGGNTNCVDPEDSDSGDNEDNSGSTDGVTGGGQTTLCSLNEYVSGNKCTPCPSGTAHLAGEDPTNPTANDLCMPNTWTITDFTSYWKNECDSRQVAASNGIDPQTVGRAVNTDNKVQCGEYCKNQNSVGFNYCTAGGNNCKDGNNCVCYSYIPGAVDNGGYDMYLPASKCTTIQDAVDPGAEADTEESDSDTDDDAGSSDDYEVKYYTDIAACGKNSEAFEFYKNQACDKHNEIGTVSNTTFDACSAGCLADPACSGFEWYHTNKKCVMSTSCNPDLLKTYSTIDWYQKTDKGKYTSVPSALGKFNVLQNQACKGRDELSTDTYTTAESCAAMCDADPSCTSFEYVPSAKKPYCNLSKTCTNDTASTSSSYAKYNLYVKNEAWVGADETYYKPVPKRPFPRRKF